MNRHLGVCLCVHNGFLYLREHSDLNTFASKCPELRQTLLSLETHLQVYTVWRLRHRKVTSQFTVFIQPGLETSGTALIYIRDQCT